MCTVCISCNFDGPLSRMTFMTIPFIHVTHFYNVGDYYIGRSLDPFVYNSFLLLSLVYVCYLYCYITFSIHPHSCIYEMTFVLPEQQYIGRSLDPNIQIIHYSVYLWSMSIICTVILLFPYIFAHAIMR
jgi:hypothetical protein